MRPKLSIAMTLSLTLLACATPTTPPAADQREIKVDGGVFYRESGALESSEIAGLWLGSWRRLSQDNEGRASLLIALAPGEGVNQPGSYASDIELFVHQGAVRLGDTKLEYRDYALIPAAAVVGELVATEPTELLFFSKGSPRWTPSPVGVDSEAIQVVRYIVAPWKGGEVSQAAGEDIPLRIKHYRNDPITGARTFLVSSGPEAEVPWERHSVIEEGFLIEGDYTLAECLAQGKQVGDYTVGGYFYRPPGIVHSGPESFTRNGATWLIRTPAKLDVEFGTSCDFATPASK